MGGWVRKGAVIIYGWSLGGAYNTGNVNDMQIFVDGISLFLSQMSTRPGIGSW